MKDFLIITASAVAIVAAAVTAHAEPYTPEETGIQNSAVLMLGKDLCGYRIKENYRVVIDDVRNNNPEQFAYYYNGFDRQIKDVRLFCNELRTDGLSKMLHIDLNGRHREFYYKTEREQAEKWRQQVDRAGAPR